MKIYLKKVLIVSCYNIHECNVEQEVVREAHNLKADGSNPSIALFLLFFI